MIFHFIKTNNYFHRKSPSHLHTCLKLIRSWLSKPYIVRASLFPSSFSTSLGALILEGWSNSPLPSLPATIYSTGSRNWFTNSFLIIIFSSGQMPWDSLHFDSQALWNAVARVKMDVKAGIALDVRRRVFRELTLNSLSVQVGNVRYKGSTGPGTWKKSSSFLEAEEY